MNWKILALSIVTLSLGLGLPMFMVEEPVKVFGMLMFNPVGLVGYVIMCYVIYKVLVRCQELDSKTEK